MFIVPHLHLFVNQPIHLVYQDFRQPFLVKQGLNIHVNNKNQIFLLLINDFVNMKMINELNDDTLLRDIHHMAIHYDHHHHQAKIIEIFRLKYNNFPLILLVE